MATDARFNISATDKTQAAFKSVRSSLGSLTKRVFSARSAIFGLVGAGGFGAMIVSVSKATKETLSYSDALNVSVKEMGAWGYAANTVSLSQEKLNDILKDTSEKIGDAFANEGGEAVEVLQRLNLNAREMAALSPDQQLLRIASQLDNVGTQAEKVQILESLASDASLLLPLLENDAAKFKQLREEAVDFGVAISRVDAEKIRAANENMDRAASVMKGVANTVTVELSPYISALAKNFAGAARTHNGFKDEVIGGLETIVVGVSYLSDVFRGLHVVWKGLEVAFAMFAEGLYATMNDTVGDLLRMAAKVPGVGDKFQAAADQIDLTARAATERTNELTTELDGLVSQPMPSDNVKQFFAEVRAEAESSAKKVAESKGQMAGTVASGGMPGGADNEKIAENFEKLKEQQRSENEQLRLHLEEQRFIVEDAFQIGLINEQERKARVEQLEKNHQDRLNAIKYEGMSAANKFATAFRDNDVRNALAAGAEMTAGVAQNNKALFELNKAFALANAAVALPDAVMQSFEKGGGYPWGLVPAGLMLAKGLAQIQAIQSTQFTGKGGNAGGAPSLSGGGGGGSTVNTTPAIPQQSGTNQIEESARQTVFVELPDDDDRQLSVRQWRNMHRELQEANPDARLVY